MTWLYRGRRPGAGLRVNNLPGADPPTLVPLASSSRQGTASASGLRRLYAEITQSKEIAGIVICRSRRRRREPWSFRRDVPSGVAAEGSPLDVAGQRADRKEGALVGLHITASSPTSGTSPPAGRWWSGTTCGSRHRPTGRRSSSKIGEHDHRGVYTPPGVAHAFYALTDMTITYMVDESTTRPTSSASPGDDPALQVVWRSGYLEPSEWDKTNPVGRHPGGAAPGVTGLQIAGPATGVAGRQPARGTARSHFG